MDLDDSDPNLELYDDFDYGGYSDYENFDEFFNFDKISDAISKKALENSNKQNDETTKDNPQNNDNFENQHSLMEKIKNELDINEKEYIKFLQKIKKARKNRKSTYHVRVKQERNFGKNKSRCTYCIRQILSLSDDWFVFKEAFYHFTYGEVFDKSLVQKLHNKICSSLGIRKATVQEGRNIRLYFNNFANCAFRIIKEGRKFLRENPEFRELIDHSKQNKKI